MRERSMYTYQEALKILAPGDQRIAKLDRVLGGALLALAPLTGGASLALIDPKTELVGLLREVTGAAPARIKATTGRRHCELIEATHTVLCVSAFIDALREELGPGYAGHELTDAERLARSGPPAPEWESLPRTLATITFPMPGVTRGFGENSRLVESEFGRLFDATAAFIEGLSAGAVLHGPDATHPDLPALRQATLARALDRYRDRFVRLGADLPEFRFWIELDEHAATRTTVADAAADVAGAVADVADAVADAAADTAEHIRRAQTDTLTELERMLASTVRGRTVRDIEARIARRAARVIDRPLWRTKVGEFRFPTVATGFVSPAYRMAIAGDGTRLSDEAWWDRHEVQEDLGPFLARYLADARSARRPLLILGHPGAGKTLLSEIIAARLPASAFTPIIVKLRTVDADAEVHHQIKAAIDSLARESVDWGRLCDESPTTKVVIFDGLDELIQATGVTQSGYIERIAHFQEEEWADGNSVVPVVTSRMLVMDRVRVPPDSVVLKLEQFDDDRVARWVDVWNQTNAQTPSFRPLSAAELLHHGDMARQPLLTTLLAIYASETGAERLDSESLSEAELYQRLLDAFIGRQVADKAEHELAPAERQRLEALLRWDLSIAAFSMFNRGQQDISEDQLEKDLGAFSNAGDHATIRSFREPLSRAKRTVAAFFFIHVSHSDEHDESRSRRSYEYLHATFGEYLVAEFTVRRLRELAQDRHWTRERLFGGPAESPVLRALLSHQPLLKREPTVRFATELLRRDENERRSIRRATLELFTAARDRGSLDGIETYQPTPFDPVTRLAAYTANLATLAVASDNEPIAFGDDFPETVWNSAVRLWQAGLDSEGLDSVIAHFDRSDGGIRGGSSHRRFLIRPTESYAAALTGDLLLEAHLLAGNASWFFGRPSDRFSLEFHNMVLSLANEHFSFLGLDYTYLVENAYRDLLERIRGHDGPLHFYSIFLLLTNLVNDAPSLPGDLPRELAREVAARSSDTMGASTRRQMIALIARCPRLAEEPEIREMLRQISGDGSPFSALLMRRLPEEVRERFAPRFDEQLRGIQIGKVGVGTVTSEMIHEFATDGLNPAVALRILQSLAETGNFVWSRVTPADLLGYAAFLPGDDAAAEQLAKYLAFHGVRLEGAGFDEAMAALRALAAEESGAPAE